MSSKQEALRKRIYEFFLANRSSGKKYTVAHFQAENVSRSTIYNIIRRAERDSGHERVFGSGRKAKIMTKKNIKRLNTMFNHRDGVSTRQAARKFKCDHSLIIKTLSRKTDIKHIKKKKIPLRTDKQQERIPGCCDRLYRKLQGKSCLLDDESYFTLTNSSVCGNDGFYSNNLQKTPASVKYRAKAKFEQKLLVWLCVSERGISKPFIAPSGLAINRHVYLEQCIKKRLVPFIEQHHSDGQYLFWPDLASCHYAGIVTDFFREKGIKFVEKSDNPPALPECRAIEDFWSILKQLVYANNWQAKNVKQLRSRILLCLKKVDLDAVKRLFGATRLKVGRVRLNGVIEKK